MIEKVTGHPMSPVPTDHFVNFDFTLHYYYCKVNNVTNYRDLEDAWVRVDSSAVESGSRTTKSIFFDGEEEYCGGVMIEWLDCTLAETYDNIDFQKDSDVSRDVLARSMPIFSPEGMRRKQQQAVDDFRKKEDEW